jgi:KipI family sensor histidine kinase inhibitor
MTLQWSGDTLLLVEWGQRIDPELNAAVIQAAERLRARLGHAVRDVVPAYCSIGIHVDPLLTDLGALERVVHEEIERVGVEAGVVEERAIVEIPVSYGGENGPDLVAVAEWANATPDDVVAWHADRLYRVYMLGFVPGFCYMGRVDSRIAMPRHRVPRERVPRGSVGIAGEQTGVYPMDTPGGWQLIGRTPTVMFDPSRTPPSLLRPGDRVRFIPVTRT